MNEDAEGEKIAELANTTEYVMKKVMANSEALNCSEIYVDHLSDTVHVEDDNGVQYKFDLFLELRNGREDDE